MCKKGMEKPMSATAIIDKILSEPIPDYTKEEAVVLLQELNIMDENGEFVEEFKPYIVDRNDEKK